MLIRKKLSADEFSNPALRYNEGCDCVQFSPDGGTTWYDQPSNDPRTSPAYLLPPLTGDDTQCRAAEGMTALVRSFVDKRIEDISDAELAGAIIGLVGFIPGFNVLWALILAFVTFAFTIAREVLEAAFTEAVYDEIRCIFFRNISENGQMDAAQFTACYAEMADLDTVPQVWVENVMNLVGFVGLSDAGVALQAEADCDDCDDIWCYEWDFSEGNGGWATYASEGSYSGGAWNSQLVSGGGGSQRIGIRRAFTPDTGITYMLVGYSCTAAGTGAQNSVFLATRLNGAYVQVSPNLILATGTPTSDNFTFADGAADELHVYLSTGLGTTTPFTIDYIQVRGTGSNPFGADNCE